MLPPRYDDGLTPLRLPLFVLLLGAVACSKSNAPSRRGPDAASSLGDDQLPANARVALTKPTGATNEDERILAAQSLVRSDMAKLDAWVALGHAWLAKARASDDDALYVNADACASFVLAKDPDHAAAADLRATALTHRGELTEARTLAERMTDRHPRDPTGWGNLADALVALGRYDEAEDAVRTMLALGPSLAALRRVAYLQWLRGDVVRAKETMKRAIEAGRTGEPQDVMASALVQQAMMAWNEGDYDTAASGFDDALERVADFPSALAGKGRVAMARGEYPQAADLFGRSYAKAAVIETAWLLGDAREAAGDAKGAADAYGLVAKRASTDPRTYSLYLSSRKERTKRERDVAVELASQAHVKRLDVYTEDALAWALYRAGMIEPAKSAMARARRLSTPDARILFHEGAIRIAGGDVKKGKEVIARALAMNRAFDWRGANEARELVR